MNTVQVVVFLALWVLTAPSFALSQETDASDDRLAEAYVAWGYHPGRGLAFSTYEDGKWNMVRAPILEGNEVERIRALDLTVRLMMMSKFPQKVLETEVCPVFDRLAAEKPPGKPTEVSARVERLVMLCRFSLAETPEQRIEIVGAALRSKSVNRTYYVAATPDLLVDVSTSKAIELLRGELEDARWRLRRDHIRASIDRLRISEELASAQTAQGRNAIARSWLTSVQHIPYGEANGYVLVWILRQLVAYNAEAAEPVLRFAWNNAQLSSLARDEAQELLRDLKLLGPNEPVIGPVHD